MRGIVKRNTLESLCSLLKREILSTYHNISKKYLPPYLAEFSFRFNNRHEKDIFKQGAETQGTGDRLSYLRTTPTKPVQFELPFSPTLSLHRPDAPEYD